jgi:hypothetical protein
MSGWTRALWRTYAAIFVLSGAASLLGAHLELRPLFGLDADALSPDTRGGLLAQYRFLRAMEVGFGLYMWRAAASLTPTARLDVLLVLWLAPASRLIARVADGDPAWGWSALTVAELLLAAALTVGTRSPP